MRWPLPDRGCGVAAVPAGAGPVTFFDCVHATPRLWRIVRGHADAEFLQGSAHLRWAGRIDALASLRPGKKCPARSLYSELSTPRLLTTFPTSRNAAIIARVDSASTSWRSRSSWSLRRVSVRTAALPEPAMIAAVNVQHHAGQTPGAASACGVSPAFCAGSL